MRCSSWPPDVLPHSFNRIARDFQSLYISLLPCLSHSVSFPPSTLQKISCGFTYALWGAHGNIASRQRLLQIQSSFWLHQSVDNFKLTVSATNEGRCGMWHTTCGTICHCYWLFVRKISF